MVGSMTRNWRWLWNSPANSHDSTQLECRGLGTPKAVRDLCLLAKENKPDLLFLIETKRSHLEMEWIPSGFCWKEWWACSNVEGGL